MNSVLKMIKFNVASINRCTEVEGPYKRFCIWFQGCDIHCPGCCNPDYQAFIPKNILTIEQLIDLISKAKEEFSIEGVTYTGGEPTLQQGLPMLTKRIKEIGLGVISFTGRKYEDVHETLSGCDVVLDGEYVAKLQETNRKLLGSENQRIICLTDRYSNIIYDWFLKKDKKIEINVNSKIVANGDKF